MHEFGLIMKHVFYLKPPQQNGFAESSPYSAISSMDRLAIEPEKIKKWREEQKQLLEEKGKLIYCSPNS